LTDPMSDKPIEPGFFNMALDRIVRSHVGQTCRTGFSDIASDNCVRCRVGQAHRMGFFSGADDYSAPQKINFCLSTSDITNYKGPFVLWHVTCIQSKLLFLWCCNLVKHSLTMKFMKM
jgi:hypothetical protein